MKILLVDDHTETLEVLTLLYRLNGRVEIGGHAQSGDEMWERLRAERFDAVSLDIQLGIEDGILLCAQLHEKYPGLFILMCSLDASEEQRCEAYAAGASFFLAKPITHQDVRLVYESYQNENSSPGAKTSASDEHSKLVQRFINEILL